MACPQIENGYMKIANELAEALMHTNLSAYQYRILWAIWRKTYGWHKKVDWIPNSQLVSMTGIRKQHIHRTVKELIERNIVTKSGYQLSFNKNYTQWRELPKQVTVTSTGSKVTSTGELKRHSFKRQKDFLSPKTPKSNRKVTDPRVKQLIDYFYHLVLEEKGFGPVIDAADAIAVQRVLKEMSEEEIKNAIQYYVNSLKAKEHGITLSVALSKHSLNLFKERTQDVCPGPSVLDKIMQAQKEMEAYAG